MNRLIAVVIALVLSACSEPTDEDIKALYANDLVRDTLEFFGYDPNYYYYYCSHTTRWRVPSYLWGEYDTPTSQPSIQSRTVKKPTIYVHNNVLYVPNTKADNGYLEYPYIKEDERYRYYGGKVRSEEYMSRIEYQRERSLIVTIEKDTNIIRNASPMEEWHCNVVREPIEEEQWGIDP